MTDLAEAKQAVELWLLARERRRNPKAAFCEVVLWEEGPWGVRVAEVTFTSKDRMAGASWMQSDLPDGLAVCAQVERVIVALLWPDDLFVEEEYDSLGFLTMEVA